MTYPNSLRMLTPRQSPATLNSATAVRLGESHHAAPRQAAAIPTNASVRRNMAPASKPLSPRESGLVEVVAIGGAFTQHRETALHEFIALHRAVVERFGLHEFFSHSEEMMREAAQPVKGIYMDGQCEGVEL